MGVWESLSNVFTGAPAKRAAEQNAALWGQTQAAGRSDIASATSRSEEALGKVGQTWQDFGNTFSGRYAPAVDTYLGALGLRGPEAAAAARTAFQTSPGYDWAREEALNATERAGYGRGMGFSGNTLTALQDRGNQVANQEWGNYLERLGGFVAPEYNAALAAAGGRAGAYGALPAIYQSAAGRQINLGQNTAQGIAGENTAAAAAELGGSANLWRLGLALAELGTGTAGKLADKPEFSGYNTTGGVRFG